MTLLSPLALLVGLTAMVPLILHLYQRRQRTLIEFSTNRFFTQSIIRSQRRLRLRRLLLLIVRIATCVLLALALARPIASLSGFGGGEGKRDIVILLDDSLSMQAKAPHWRASRQWHSAGASGQGQAGEAGNTRFAWAQGMAHDVLSELVAGDRAAVITFTGRTIGNLTHNGLELSDDLLGLSDELEQLRPSYAAGDAYAALNHAAKLFQDGAPRDRLLLVLSDVQAGDWRQTDWPQPPHVVATACVRLPAPPTDNVVADRMELSQGTAVVEQPNLLRVRLVNYREQTTPTELVLHVDEQERLRRPVELAGRSPHIERIPLVFEKPGLHRLRLDVQVRDALAADNTLYSTVRVNARLPVLLVDGHMGASGSAGASPSHFSSAGGSPSRGVSAGLGRSAAFFLRAALRAVSSDAGDVQTDSIRPDALRATDLDDYRVILLSEVRSLNVAQLERLERFVQAGGGLAIFLGALTNSTFYNDVMGAESRPLGGLLPANVLGLVEAEQTVAPLHILTAELKHPMLRRFKGTLRSALAGVAVYRTYAVEPRDAWVLASLDRQRPLLVERNYGRGKVILCAAAPHPRWTNLPLRRFFVPFCHRLVSYLAGGAVAKGEHLIGQDLELLRGGWDPGHTIYVQRPDGARTRATVKVVGADPVAYVPAGEVRQAGFYESELPPDAGMDGLHADVNGRRHGTQQQGTGGQATSGTRHGTRSVLAVNTPRRESSPNVMDLEAAKQFAGNWRLNVIDTTDIVRSGGTNDGVSLLQAGWVSRGMWDTLLWVVFALLLAEPLIANRILRWRASRHADANGPRHGSGVARREPRPPGGSARSSSNRRTA